MSTPVPTKIAELLEARTNHCTFDAWNSLIIINAPNLLVALWCLSMHRCCYPPIPPSYFYGEWRPMDQGPEGSLSIGGKEVKHFLVKCPLNCQLVCSVKYKVPSGA